MDNLFYDTSEGRADGSCGPLGSGSPCRLPRAPPFPHPVPEPRPPAPPRTGRPRNGIFLYFLHLNPFNDFSFFFSLPPGPRAHGRAQTALQVAPRRALALTRGSRTRLGWDRARGAGGAHCRGREPRVFGRHSCPPRANRRNRRSERGSLDTEDRLVPSGRRDGTRGTGRRRPGLLKSPEGLRRVSPGSSPGPSPGAPLRRLWRSAGRFAGTNQCLPVGQGCPLERLRGPEGPTPSGRPTVPHG